MRRNYFTFAVGVGTVACAASVACAALLGVLVDYPSITFADVTAGSTTYTKSTELFSVRADAVAIRLDPFSAPVFITSPAGFGALTLDIVVNSSGIAIAGHPGEDLIVSGTVTLGASTYSGTLLTGEIANFGSQDTGGTTDLFDFRFTATGGALAAIGGPFYAKDIGVTLTSENSNFINFGANFAGRAKGLVGVVLPPTGGGTGGPGGCTPGYWKQSQHFDNYPAPYTPNTSFETIFGRDVPGTPTFLEALRIGGGGLNALMRHATAAFLNAANPNIHPDPMFDTVAEVIAGFRSAYDSGNYEPMKNLMEDSNEIGCPLN